MQALEKWHEASSKLRTHKIRRHSAQCSRPGFVNHSATFLSKHATALFLALRFTPFCFNVSNQFTPRFLRPLIFGLPLFPCCFYIFKTFFLYEYNFFLYAHFFKNTNKAFVYLQNQPYTWLLSKRYTRIQGLWFRASSITQIKTPNQMQQSIVKFIALSYRHCSTCFGHYYAHHREPVKLPLQPLVSV